MTHAQLVQKAVAWLRFYRCGVVLSELVECKISRADFLADRDKPFRRKQELGLGCERFYLTPADMLGPEELPAGWGLLECHNRKIRLLQPAAKNLRTATGFRYEMNLLLASLRRVEIRIEPRNLTEFLKWKNRLAEYNRGQLPEGVVPTEEEPNFFLETEAVPNRAQ